MNAVTSHREVIPIKFKNKIFGKLSTSTLIEYENLPEDFLFRLCLNKKYGDPYLLRFMQMHSMGIFSQYSRKRSE